MTPRVSLCGSRQVGDLCQQARTSGVVSEASAHRGEPQVALTEQWQECARMRETWQVSFTVYLINIDQ